MSLRWVLRLRFAPRRMTAPLSSVDATPQRLAADPGTARGSVHSQRLRAPSTMFG
jgi:hypothetical protein